MTPAPLWGRQSVLLSAPSDSFLSMLMKYINANNRVGQRRSILECEERKESPNPDLIQSLEHCCNKRKRSPQSFQTHQQADSRELCLSGQRME